ncbi:MAG: hypothetical protein LQ346_008101 [Caloplaca aetnensis]|nr:MAG: hypothetical protein LQ346_008101 [Caloplaca aetnensis]
MKATDRKSLSPRKALSITAGNAQAHEITMTTPTIQKTRPGSPAKYSENEASPWRIRITVQAEQDKLTTMGVNTVPQCSPSKIFAERTFTTTVPVKSGEETSPTRRKRKTTPRKSQERISTSRSRSKARDLSEPKLGVGAPTEQAGITPSSTPKRGRGRPRKNINTPLAESSGHKTGASNNPGRSLPPDKEKSRCAGKSSEIPSNGSENVETCPAEPADNYHEFDSVMESEGFSMVSVSSLPSTQSLPSESMEADRLGINTSPSNFRRQVTPTKFQDSPAQPPPPKPALSLQHDREIDKPTSGTPKLARVVRAGIALQGVLSPINQRSGSSPRVNTSSSLSSAASPRERLDDLFSGFGPGTRRELRAGLRLGEELAKRQHLESQSRNHQDQTTEDVFATDPHIRYPELPDTGEPQGYNLKVPAVARRASPSFSNTQLPSPARSEVDADDDRMSWKYDTLPQRVASVPSDQGGLTDTGVPNGTSHLIDDTMWERDAEWQRERDAVSKQIQEANLSQVIVIDSDDEDDGSPETDLEDDIWLEEARNSRTEHSTSDVPPIFRQTEAPKPRRSQLPSPWMRKNHDVSESTSLPSDADLFWQPSQIGVRGNVPGNPVKSSALKASSSSFGSSSLDNSSPIAKGRGDSRKLGAASNDEWRAGRESDDFLWTRGLKQIDAPNDHDQRADNPVKENLRAEFTDTSEDEAESEDEPFTDDEDLDTNLLSHLSMENGCTQLSEGDTELAPDTTTSSTGATFESEVPQPQTPSSSTPFSKPKTPKHVRFSTEKPRLYAAPEVSGPQSAPLPPAPTSWFGLVTSLLPTWGTTAPAAVPLPSRPKHKIELAKVDSGPLPLYMPWTQSHWWALIHIVRQSQADPGAFPFDPNMAYAKYLGATVTVKKWAKRLTKQDCVVIQRMGHVLRARGTVKGMESTYEKGGKKQWGMAPGHLIDLTVVVSAVVSQWASDVQDGICTIGWSDRAGIKAGSEKEIWTKADLPVDGPKVVYVL